MNMISGTLVTPPMIYPGVLLGIVVPSPLKLWRLETTIDIVKRFRIMWDVVQSSAWSLGSLLVIMALYM